MNKAVYIHIPFCKHICSYCDFCKLFYTKKWITPYLESLEHEVKTNYKNEMIETIYIGGGTPSSLTINELKQLFKIIDIFKTNIKEFTFECNIEDINKELLEFLKTTKVNRLSIGLETTNKKLLNYLGRIYIDDYKERIELAKMYFSNINIDLMYAIKNETIEDLINDIKTIKSLNVPHISTYSLIIEEHTKLMNEKPIDEDLDYQMYKTIENELNEYNHYEVSNFAKENHESLHNLTYWNNKEYYGFGLGASGYVDNVRYENTKDIIKYINKEYINEQNVLSELEQMQNEMILGLRKLKGVNLIEFEKKYNKKITDVFDIEEQLKTKKLIIENDYIYINKNYIYLSNEILINFI